MVRLLGANPTTQLRNALILVFLTRASFALVIWIMSGPAGFFTPDSDGYLRCAQSLLHGSFSIYGVPEIYRTPGYPLVLVPAVALGHPVVVGLLENFLFAVASAFLIWKIAEHLCPRDNRAAKWAVLLYCFEPVGFIYADKLMTETMFCTVLLLFIWLLLRFYSAATFKALVLFTVALGCATYVRPVTLYLGLWMVPLLFLFPRSLPWRQRAIKAMTFIVVFALFLAPWVIRVAKVSGYRGFSPAPDFISYFYLGAAVQGRLEHKSVADVRDKLGYYTDIVHDNYFKRHPDQKGWSQAQIFQFQGKEGRKVIAEHPFLYAFIHVKGCIVLMLDPGVTDILKPLSLYPEGGGLLDRVSDQGMSRSILWFVRVNPGGAALLVILVGQLMVYYFLALRGLGHLAFEPRVLLVWLVLYLILTSGGPIGLARYRAPIMPVVCIVAGAFIASKHSVASAQKVLREEVLPAAVD